MCLQLILTPRDLAVQLNGSAIPITSFFFFLLLLGSSMFVYCPRLFLQEKNTNIQPGSAPLALKRMINFRDSRIFFGLTIKSKQVVFVLQHMQ